MEVSVSAHRLKLAEPAIMNLAVGVAADGDQACRAHHESLQAVSLGVGGSAARSTRRSRRRRLRIGGDCRLRLIIISVSLLFALIRLLFFIAWRPRSSWGTMALAISTKNPYVFGADARVLPFPDQRAALRGAALTLPLLPSFSPPSRSRGHG